MKWFFLRHLPLAFIVGLKIREINNEKAIVSVPYKYLTKNPFHSIYFAALSMAAELSSGILGLSAVLDSNTPLSMLVLDMKADFTKKATSEILFTCNDGKHIKKAIEKAIAKGEGETIQVFSEGYDSNNNLVAKFSFTWTFKSKNK